LRKDIQKYYFIWLIKELARAAIILISINIIIDQNKLLKIFLNKKITKLIHAADIM